MPAALPRCAAALALSLTALSPWPAARALPLNYAGSTTVGVDVDPDWSSAWFSHALDGRNGLGLSTHLLPAQPASSSPASAASAGTGGTGGDRGRGEETYLLLDWTRRLRRWNLPRAQANVWLFAGIGGRRVAAAPGPASGAAPPGERLVASPGLQVDIETTRLRFEARGRLLLAPGSERSLLTATAGVALTPAHYQGVQPWLELQLRALPGVTDAVELVPRLRLVHRRLVLDLGVGSRGSLLGGFSYTL